jgi:glycosyltransferase involved in cell wall biosynthesis
MKPRVLFVLKHREVPDRDEYACSYLSSGLHNSAGFVADMLNKAGVEAKVVHVRDNNYIAREVHKFKPTHVILEALWVVPEKFDVLLPIFPDVKWIVRIHSELAFLAQEGIAMDWINRYVQYKNVFVASNSEETTRDLKHMVGIREDKILFLPNYYPARHFPGLTKDSNEYFDVACFGAIRPMKNQLVQAHAALRYARSVGKTLRFHVNGSRAEQGGENNLKNLEAFFAHTPDAQLVEHCWMNHKDFVHLLYCMDLGMQVSFSETFNIVTADMVFVGLPIVVSDEVPWASGLSKAKCTDVEDIVDHIGTVIRYHALVGRLNSCGLKRYVRKARRVWLNWLGR